MMIGEMIRDWRAVRGLSQLALALDAQVSARHVSFVESGRSRPSREMVLRLAEALGVPLRDRNAMLAAAGFAAEYASSTLETPELAEVRSALDMILAAHEPHPAVALDAGFRVVASNSGFVALLQAVGVEPGVRPSLVELVFMPGAMRDAIVNWPEVAAYMAHRMRENLRYRGGDSPLRPVFEEALRQPGVAAALAVAGQPRQRAVVPVVIEAAGQRSSWITTVTTFGAPQDAFVEELTIEQFFPAAVPQELPLSRAPGGRAGRARR